MKCPACGSLSTYGRCRSCGEATQFPGEEVARLNPVGSDISLEEERAPYLTSFHASLPLGLGLSMDRRKLRAAKEPTLDCGPEIHEEVVLEFNESPKEITGSRERVPKLRVLLSFAIDASLVGAFAILPLWLTVAVLEPWPSSTRGAVSLASLIASNTAAAACGAIFVALVAFVYLTLSGALEGKTVGDRVVGMRAVVRSSGERPSLGRAAIRAAAAVFGTVAFLAGPLWALFDDEAQALHDKIAGTVPILDR